MPEGNARPPLALPPNVRNMGIHVCAGKGAGKSRLLGRIIGWQDFLRGVPLVIIDPHGPVIANFLDQLCRQPGEAQPALWRRVRYVDLAGRDGQIVPFPLYYRSGVGEESLDTVAGRYLEVVRRLDPALESASILGWNALARLGRAAGIILAALGLQITEAESLVQHPEAWEERIRAVARLYPEAVPAAEFFLSSYIPEVRERRQLSATFLTKLGLFAHAPTFRAMVGAGEPGIRWPEVVAKRQAVLLDLGRVHDRERKVFSLLWVYQSLVDFIRRRGPGRHLPLAVVIDELPFILGSPSRADDLLADDLEELINLLARNNMVWLTLAHQELYQTSERIRLTLLTMGTQILGATSDVPSAIALGRRFLPPDPFRAKRFEAVFASERGATRIIDRRMVDFPLAEQEFLAARAFLTLPKFRFLVAASPEEGSLPTSLRGLSIARVDRGRYPLPELIRAAQSRLMRRDGVPIAAALGQIAERGRQLRGRAGPGHTTPALPPVASEPL